MKVYTLREERKIKRKKKKKVIEMINNATLI